MTQSISYNKRHEYKPLLRDADNNVIADVSDTPIHLNNAMRPCFLAEHKVKWGPLCRNMKRKPKNRENVYVECRSCGKHIIFIPR